MKRTGASLGNGILSILKGGLEFGEDISNYKYIDVSNKIQGITTLIDIFSGKELGSNKSLTKLLQDATMYNVSQRRVSSLYSNFYQTEIGKALDREAYEPLKSTGWGAQLLEGLSYEGTMATVATLTGGGASALAYLAYMAGTGRETQNYWGDKKDKAIGNEWLTNENYVKGLNIGSLTGAWEALTHFLGGDMILSKNRYYPLSNSAARVAIDTAFNAGDIPIRAAIDSIVEGKNINQALEDRGGYDQMKLDALLGFAGSSLGEGIIKGMELRQAHIKNKKIENMIANGSTNEIFDAISKGNGRYGIDQGLFKVIKIHDRPYYNELKRKLINKYNFSARDATFFLDNLDRVGACSYAASANDVVSHFKNDPVRYEEIFGFPLYRKNANGVVVLNDGELLMDMYVYVNSFENGGRILNQRPDGTMSLINFDNTTGRPVKIFGVSQRYMLPGERW